ncbi:uncharacterized protein LOC121804159 [Salvia splendens]|uniref:uncharacterized protein LOC121804159 n=1 Tax=Salvia splendens TaxID=180675 RepID=UPI001C263111|nr:uncharacterized protein LOC121804159 [Salvia splendens]
MEIFGKLEINLPFLQALKLPLFNRFIKDFIAGKAKADGKIVIGESVSTVIQKRRLPSKMADPGMFTLHNIIWDVKIEHAMCDLGASINVLPFSVYKRLTVVSLLDTKVVIQLVDRSCISHEGVLENVNVRVHDFLYPADFHVIRINESEAGESSREQLAAAELNDSIEEEVSGWCAILLTQNMTDEEINNAIMGFCQKPTSTGSTGFAQLNSLEKVPDFGELAAKNVKKNPLP